MTDKDSVLYIENGDEVIRQEQEFIKTASDFDKKRDSFYGLAISGGGIRSASFGLGVLQGLVAYGTLKKIDYLSTVSGGGYIGSSLTWFLNNGYGTETSNFPFGSIGVGDRIKDKKGNEILDFIRQHGNYLVPGQGLNAISLFGLILRSMFISLFVYFFFTTILMVVLQRLFGWVVSLIDASAKAPPFTYLIWGAFIIVLLLILSAFIFALGSRLSVGSWTTRYVRLIRSQRRLGLAWTAIFAFLVFGSLPYVYDALQDLWRQMATAGTSTILGVIMGLIHFRKEQTSTTPRQGGLASLRIVLGAAALLYGLLLGGYTFATYLDFQWIAIAVVVLAALIFGFFVNVNYLTFHRMYRDRLMETFMPNKDNIQMDKWGPATNADEALLENMCHDGQKARRPYQLINTNIVLTDSPRSKFRGRGGDNFLLSPLYSGSDATGWRKTAVYMKKGGRGMTLPTAMSISGAAVNPNTGVAGQGLMRNKLVSILLSLLNIRLGYWAPNPNIEGGLPFPPNFIIPGLKSGLLGSGLKEKANFVELSDGGHFENLGIYELVRRKLKLIIVSDAGADPRFDFGDLSNAVERIRVDFGAKVRFDDPETDLTGVLPGSETGLLADKYMLAQRGYAVGEITYEDGSKGTLVYLKSTLTEGLPEDIYGYKSANPTFPDQTTADQFFDENQFEAYRELGYQISKQMLEANKKRPDESKWIAG